MSENSVASQIATEVIVTAAVIVAVYGGVWAVKKLAKPVAALKPARFSKVKP